MSKDQIVKQLVDSIVIAVLRAPDHEIARKTVKAYVDAGITAIELTTSTPDWQSLLEPINVEFGDRALIGLGTVTNRGIAQTAIDCGAKFIVSPFTEPGVIGACLDVSVPVIPGAMTPTEIAQAIGMGADMVKIFPASAVGGPKYVKALLAPMPSWKLVPTGGVTPENAIDYLNAGAVAVGLGGNLAPKEKVSAGDWQGVMESVKEFMDSLKNQMENKS